MPYNRGEDFLAQMVRALRNKRSVVQSRQKIFTLFFEIEQQQKINIVGYDLFKTVVAVLFFFQTKLI